MPDLHLQLYSLRRETSADAPGTLSRVRGLGYDGVELAGDYGWSAAEWRVRLAAAELSVVGAHVLLPQLEGELDRQMEFHKAVGNRRLIVPALARDLHTPAGFREAALRLMRLAASVKGEGFEILFHNHDVEFQPLEDGSRGIDILLAETDPSLVRFEFDTYWIEKGGEPSLDFLERNAAHTGMIHAKELRRRDCADVPAGQGDIPFPAILGLARTHGWPVVVEFEGEGAEEAVRQSAAYLRPLL